jgi:hypothetical protein
MTITRAAVAVGALILLASCGSGDFVDTAPVEKDVKATIDGPGSVKVKSVDCPTDEAAEVGATFTCPYELVDGSSGEITITVQTEKGGGSWAVSRPASGQAEETIRTGYEKQTDDKVKSVTCPDPLESAESTAIFCDVVLKNGKKGRALVTIVDGKIRWATK